MAAVEQKKSYLVTKQFKGINSKSNRTAIEETEFSWLENLMPLGYGNIKALPSSDNQSVAFGNTVTQLFSVNIFIDFNIICMLRSYSKNSAAKGRAIP